MVRLSENLIPYKIYCDGVNGDDEKWRYPGHYVYTSSLALKDAAVAWNTRATNAPDCYTYEVTERP
jgi:hypothetical protein